MNAGIMVAVVLIPILCGALIPLIPFKSRTQMAVYVECVVLINSLLVLTMLFHRPQDVFVLFRFTGNLSVSFRLDGFRNGVCGNRICALAFGNAVFF